MLFSIAGYTFSLVSKLDIPLCYALRVLKAKKLIYVLCEESPKVTIRAHEDSIPYDLLMITVAEEIAEPRDMVGVEDTNTLYVPDFRNKCIWKIDMDNSKVEIWLSELPAVYSLSVANNNHLLVLRLFKGLRFFEIYQQDAKLVRSFSLPKDFLWPFHAIQKPNGEFIVSHNVKERYRQCVSFLSIDGHIISQFRLRETVGFEDVQHFSDDSIFYNFAVDMFDGDVYMLDFYTMDWDLTDLSFNTSNSSEESTKQVASFRGTVGDILSQFGIEWTFSKNSVQLYWDMDENNLLVVDAVFGDMYQFDTKTLNWSQTGLLMHDWMYYDAKKMQFIVRCDRRMYIVTFTKT